MKTLDAYIEEGLLTKNSHRLEDVKKEVEETIITKLEDIRKNGGLFFNTDDFQAFANASRNVVPQDLVRVLKYYGMVDDEIQYIKQYIMNNIHIKCLAGPFEEGKNAKLRDKLIGQIGAGQDARRLNARSEIYNNYDWFNRKKTQQFITKYKQLFPTWSPRLSEAQEMRLVMWHDYIFAVYSVKSEQFTSVLLGMLL